MRAFFLLSLSRVNVVHFVCMEWKLNVMTWFAQSDEHKGIKSVTWLGGNSQCEKLKRWAKHLTLASPPACSDVRHMLAGKCWDTSQPDQQTYLASSYQLALFLPAPSNCLCSLCRAQILPKDWGAVTISLTASTHKRCGWWQRGLYRLTGYPAGLLFTPSLH